MDKKNSFSNDFNSLPLNDIPYLRNFNYKLELFNLLLIKWFERHTPSELVSINR